MSPLLRVSCFLLLSLKVLGHNECDGHRTRKIGFQGLMGDPLLVSGRMVALRDCEFRLLLLPRWPIARRESDLNL